MPPQPGLGSQHWAERRSRLPPAVAIPQVIKLMQSFKSKEFVKEAFAWRHYYWCAPRAQRALQRRRPGFSCQRSLVLHP
jgi:hypothetical protein